MVQSVIQSVSTVNHHQLSATIYKPKGEMKGAVLIVPAMGATQRYYVSFATWLAMQDYMVVTFDYYGIGLSQSGHLRDTSVTIIDWAKIDCAAMVEAVLGKAAGKPL